MRFTTALTTISSEPDSLSTTVSQGLYGESVQLQAQVGDFCEIRNQRDGYEGFVPRCHLVEQTRESSHFVCTASTLLFSQPDIKTPSPLRLLFGSELVLKQKPDVADSNSTGATEIFRETDNGLFVLKDHCLPMDDSADQHIADMAERCFLGVPYLWGGRSVDGFDCSGLVQMSAFAAGVRLPRDSGMQEAFLQNTVTKEEADRSDLVFWPGHVGIMLDHHLLLHATAHSMLSVVEPLDVVIARAGVVSSIKRV